jgi:hypothetical protein
VKECDDEGIRACMLRARGGFVGGAGPSRPDLMRIVNSVANPLLPSKHMPVPVPVCRFVLAPLCDCPVCVDTTVACMPCVCMYAAAV